LDKHDIVCAFKKLQAELERAPTRKEIRSVLSTRQIDKHFGTFTALCLAVNGKIRALGKTPHEKALEKYEIKTGSFQKSYATDLKPWHGKYNQTHPNDMVTVFSFDHHAQYYDPFSWFVYLDTCKRIQPTVAGLGGDTLDCYSVSSYNTDPNRLLSLQTELDHVRFKMLKPLREACPNSQIDFFLGNHEWRLWKILVSQMRGALAGLDSLQIPNLLHFDDYEINLVAKPSVIAPTAKKMKNHKIYGGCYAVTHGTCTSRNHAGAELAKFNMSGSSGHTHHHQEQTRVILGENGKQKALRWISAGCMASDAAGDYMWDFTRQNQGFVIAHIYNKSVKLEYIDTTGSFAVVGGKYYYRDKLKRKG